MEIFNKGLYYAASKPPDASGNTCHRGAAKVYGAHYIESEEDDNPLSGPKKSPANFTALEIASADPGMIFGFNLQQDPTCKSTATNITGDESFGYGAVEMSRQVNPGKFFLNYTISGVPATKGSDDSTQSVSNGLTDVKTELPSPHVPVSFQSWALIYE
jgi:hypothetical protein